MLPSNLWKALREAHYLAAREGNAQSRNTCRLCQKTTKWRTELSEGICVSHSSFIGADFLQEGGGGLAISGRLTNRLVSRFGQEPWFGSNNTELLRGVIGPISLLDDCLNTVFDEVVSLRGTCRNRCLATVPSGKASTFCISFWVCQKDFPQLQERNNLFVDRPVK